MHTWFHSTFAKELKANYRPWKSMHCLSVFGFLLKQDNNRNYLVSAYSVIHGLYSLSHLICSKPLGNYYYCHFMDGFPDSSVGKESACNPGDRCLIHWLGRSAGEGIGYPLQYSWASLVAQMVKNPPAIRGDLGLIPGLGRSPGEGKGYPLQYSGLENSMTI